MCSSRARGSVDLIHAVVEAISEAEDADPADLDPIYEAIDPDALNALFAGKDGPAGRVDFRYCGYDVTVYRDGRVTLADRSDH